MSNTFHKTQAKRWTKEEEQHILNLRAQGYTKEQIALATNRSLESVGIKLKRLGKRNNNYNQEHINEKYLLNHDFLQKVQPKSVLDLFCGENSFYKTHCNDLKIISNDIEPTIAADFNLDALKLLCFLYYKGQKFDLIDLDPFGSAADCFDLAIKMSRKGLIITLGELGHKRFKRLDYVKRYYSIESLEDFTTANIVNKIMQQGTKHKKSLIPIAILERQNISRVYFRIEPLKFFEAQLPQQHK